ncbi:MAG: hypothetical protein AAFO04_16495 [Cyanobacteria bacterium J06592_8]
MFTISFFPVLLCLGIAGIAFWIGFGCREEIVRLSTNAIALFCLLLAVSFTPWFILLLFVVFLLGFKMPKNDWHSQI